MRDSDLNQERAIQPYDEKLAAAFVAGKQAFAAHEDKESNPHPVGSDVSGSWLNGYEEGIRGYSDISIQAADHWEKFADSPFYAQVDILPGKRARMSFVYKFAWQQALEYVLKHPELIGGDDIER